MTAQHDESAESEKRLRYESSAIWDEAKDPSGSGRWASPIVWAGGDECNGFVRKARSFRAERDESRMPEWRRIGLSAAAPDRGRFRRRLPFPP